MRRRILYFHHGGAIGGAPLSLFYLLEQLDRRIYDPVVIVLKPGPVVDLFQSASIDTHVVGDIFDFSHTELEWYRTRAHLVAPAAADAAVSPFYSRLPS